MYTFENRDSSVHRNVVWKKAEGFGDDDDDEVMLNVLRCQLTYRDKL